VALVVLAVWPEGVGVLFVALSGYLIWWVSKRLATAANDHWRRASGAG
jgi:hypothetical protein